MNYIKKICLLKEQCAGFSTNGKPLNGMVKCEQTPSCIKIELSILDLAPPKEDNYLLFIGNSSKNCVYSISCGFCVINGSTDLLDVTYPFACAVLLEKSSKVILFGKTLDYSFSQKEFLDIYKQKSLTLYLEEKEIEKEIDEAFLYQDDIVATENYYDNADVDLKNLTLKEDENEKPENASSTTRNILQEEMQENATDPIQNDSPCHSIKEEIAPIQEIAADDVKCEGCNDEDCPPLTEFAKMINNDQTECFCVNEDVENLLNSYPRFPELENAIYGSRWVVITLEDCEYYFGKATLGEDIYLCYAVRGEEGNCPDELKNLATFIPSPYSKNVGYYVMFQKEA